MFLWGPFFLGSDSGSVVAFARECKPDLRFFTRCGTGDEGFSDDLPYARCSSHLGLADVVQGMPAGWRPDLKNVWQLMNRY